MIRLWSFRCGVIGQSSELDEKRGLESDGGELSTHPLLVPLSTFSFRPCNHPTRAILARFLAFYYPHIYKVRTAIGMMSSSKELSIYQGRGTR